LAGKAPRGRKGQESAGRRLQESAGRYKKGADVFQPSMPPPSNTHARRPGAIAVIGLVLLACLPVAGSANAQGDTSSSSKVKVATTGNRSELVDTIPITKKPQVSPRVIMSLTPGVLGALQNGDQLEVNTEAEITTDCRFESSECVGEPYNFNPKIGARIVISTSTTSAAGFEVVPRQEVNCRQKTPNRQHHCVFTLRPGPFQVDLATLGCPASGCFVNLVMDAWHKRGSPKRNVILIGANNRNGKIKQDKGRLNAIRTRNPLTAPPPDPAGTFTTGTIEPTTNAIPLNPAGEQVIYSVELANLRDGEQLYVRGGLTTDVSQLMHNANVSTKIFLTDSPAQTDRGVLSQEVADLKGEITENNGFNCTRKQTPCPSNKVGVLAIKKDATAPLYANLILNVSGFGHAGPGTFLPIPPQGGLEVTRYPPSANG
jgi:hypothetical protein